VLHLVRDWRYRAKSRQLLRDVTKAGGPGGEPAGHVLDDPDMFEAFCEGLPSKFPPKVGGPVIDTIKELFKDAWDHREEIVKFILEIIALFPK
jgi:hypothetical protein